MPQTTLLRRRIGLVVISFLLGYAPSTYALTFTDVTGTGFTPGGTATVTGTINSTDGVDFANFQYLNKNTNGETATTFNGGQIDTSFDTGVGPNQVVRDIIAYPDGSAIIVGGFTAYKGTSRGYIAKILNDGSVDTTFASGTGANGSILSIFEQSDGKFLIAGSFTTYNGTARQRIARLNADGSLDTSFNSGTGPSGTVNKIVQTSNGKVYIGGNFATVGGTTSYSFAKLDSDGTLDTSLSMGSKVTAQVFDFVVQSSGKIVLGGAFESYDGYKVGPLIRIDDTGSLDNTFLNIGVVNTSSQGGVQTLEQQSDGKLLVGGGFSAYQGEVTNNIVRVTANGELDTSFTAFPGASSAVYRIKQDSTGRIYVGGVFSSMDGLRSVGIARLNSNGTYDTSFQVGEGLASYGYAIGLISDASVLVGGDFTSYNTEEKNNLVRLHTGLSAIATDPNWSTCTLTNDVTAGKKDLSYSYESFAGSAGFGFNDIRVGITQPNNKIIIGGSMAWGNMRGSTNLNKIDATTGELDSTFNPGSGPNQRVRDIKPYGANTFLIGGAFTKYGAELAGGVALINSDGTLNQSFDTSVGTNGEVYSIEVQSDGKVIIAGAFTTVNGVARNRIARLEIDGSLDATFNPGTGANGTIYSTDLQSDGKIIAGGSFTTYSSTSRSGLTRINSDGSLDTGFSVGIGTAPAYGQTVLSIYINESGSVYIGGHFTSYNGTTRNKIAKLNSNGSLDTSWDAGSGPNAAVYSIIGFDSDRVLATGEFTSVGSNYSTGSVVFNSNGSVYTGYRSNKGRAPVYAALETQNSNILLMGSFSLYEGVQIRNIALVDRTGIFQPKFLVYPGFSDSIRALDVQPDNKIIVGGQFGRFGNTTAGGMVRLNADGSLDTSFNVGSGAGGGNIIPIYDLEVLSTGKILVVGDFLEFNGQSANKIVMLNSDGSIDTGFDSGTGMDYTPLKIIEQPDGKILIAGYFLTYNGVSRQGIVRIEANGTLDTSFDPGTGTDYGLYTIALQDDGKIVIGGEFYGFNEQEAYSIARLNSDGSLDDTFVTGSGIDYLVESLLIQDDGKIVIGGAFGSYNGNEANSLVRVNADGSYDDTFVTETGPSGDIYGIYQLSNDNLLLIGNFGTYNEVYVPFFAKISSTGALDTSVFAGEVPNDLIRDALVTSDGNLLLAGDFTDFYGGTNRHLTKLYLESTGATFTCTIDIPEDAQGYQIVHLRGVSIGGAVVSEDFEWMLDSEEPSGFKLSVDGSDKFTPGSKEIYTKEDFIKFKFHIRDTYSTIEKFKVSNKKDFRDTKWKDYDGDVKLELKEEGDVHYYIKFKDSAGNTTETYTQKVVVDRTAPELTVDTIPNSITPTVTGNAIGAKFVKVWVNGKVYGQDSNVELLGKWEVKKTDLRNETNFGYGENFVVVEAEDQAGNKKVLEFNFTVLTSAQIQEALAKQVVETTPSIQESSATLGVSDMKTVVQVKPIKKSNQTVWAVTLGLAAVASIGGFLFVNKKYSKK